MNKLLGILERGFVVLALLLYSGGLVPLIAGYGDQVQGNPKSQAIWLGVYAITLPLVVAGWKSIVRTAMRDKLLIALIGIALASTLWSVAPQITLRRDVALVFSTLFGVFLAARYSLKEQLRLLAWALGIGALLSIVFSLTSPLAAWKGIYAQKNLLGRSMAISAMVFLIHARSSYRFRWIGWSGFIISVGLVVMSTSKTALVVLVTLIALWPLFRALQRYHTWVVPILIHAVLAGGIISMLLVDNIEPLLAAMGKSVTLTGRTELWTVLIDMIKQQPWLGYGYGAFWLGYEGPSADVLRVITRWAPDHSHNGFLDLALELGLLGLLVFMLGFFRGLLRAVTWLRLSKTAEGLWPLLFFMILVLSNLTLNTIMAQNNLVWILYTAIVLSTSAELDQVSQSGPYKTTLSKGRLLKGV